MQTITIFPTIATIISLNPTDLPLSSQIHIIFDLTLDFMSKT